MDFSQHDRFMFEVYDARTPWYPEDPNWDDEYDGLVDRMREAFRGRTVLEVGCGSGHMAHRLCDVAEKVVGIDISAKRIQFAQAKGTSLKNVEFLVGDAYALDDVPGQFNAAYASAWFSHVPQARYGEFLGGLHRRLGGSGAVVFLIDETENDENAFQKPGSSDYYKRGGKLASGEVLEIVDNKFTEEDYNALFSSLSSEMTIHIGKVRTWVYYVVK